MSGRVIATARLLAAIVSLSSLLSNALGEQQATLGVAIGQVEPAPLPVSNPTVPFWSAHPESDNPLAKVGSQGPLTHDADVCIIGTGTTGVSAAYHVARGVAERPLSKDPLKIVLLEARDFCEFAKRPKGDIYISEPFQFRRFWGNWCVHVSWSCTRI